jgi:hypothetical protein
MLKLLKGDEKRRKSYLRCRNSISNSGFVCFLSFNTFSSQLVNQLGLVNLKKGDKEGWYGMNENKLHTSTAFFTSPSSF